MHFIYPPEDTMPADSVMMRSHRDSWPPTILRLQPRTVVKDGEPRPLLEISDDEDPLTYFLTPAPAFEDQQVDHDMEMDFDAGIEDPSQPREIVRSVSPSTLDGLSKPSKARPASPDFDSDMTSPDEDEDEDFIRFSPNNSRLTSFRDLYIDGLGQRPESPVFGGRSTNALLSPASFPAPRASRSRTPSYGRVGRSRSVSVRARPSHLWREPSPDVWSIEEETEEEMGETGSSNMEGEYCLDSSVQQKAAKPKKKVRFILPVKE